MPSLPKFSLLGALVALIALLALPAAAEATLVYVKNPMNPSVFAANDNGRRGFQGGAGVEPEGLARRRRDRLPARRQRRQARAEAGGGRRRRLAGSSDQPPGRLLRHLLPDSKLIAAVRGPEIGKGKLVLIDVVSGTLLRTVASGYFSGFSFSPDGTRLAYSVPRRRLPPRSDVFTATVGAGKPVQITKGGNSLDPLWGPRQDRLRQAARRREPQVRPEERALPDESGGQAGQAPHPHQGRPAAAGPLPDRVVGQRQPAAGRVRGTGHQLRGHRQPQDRRPEGARQEGDGEQGFVGTALSSDGTTVLGFTGGFEPGPNHDVATIPYGGGKTKALVKNGFEPDWSR